MMFACDQLSKETDFIEGTVCDEDASYPDEILLDLPSEFLETVIGEINKSRYLFIYYIRVFKRLDMQKIIISQLDICHCLEIMFWPCVCIIFDYECDIL